MCGKLRDWYQVARSARDDLMLAWLALLAFAIGGCTASGQEPGEWQARAALALASAERERLARAGFSDLAAAEAEARRRGEPLVVWVGLSCTDYPDLCRELAGAVHFRLDRQHGDATPRIVVRDASGAEWFVRAKNIGPGTAARLRERWTPLPGRLQRSDAGIQEEFR